MHSDVYLTVDEVNRPSHFLVRHPGRGKEGAAAAIEDLQGVKKPSGGVMDPPEG